MKKKTYEIKYTSIETSSDIFGEASKTEGYAVYCGDVKMSYSYSTEEMAQKELDKIVSHNL